MEILLFALALFVLFYSGGIVVRSLIWIGRYFDISEYALSLVLVAFATSLPELFVGISSAVNNVQELSLGDLVGANVLNVTLVVGIAMVFAGRGLIVDRPTAKKDIYVTGTMLLLPALLMADGALSRPDGLVLLLAFAAYTSDVLNEGRTSPKVNQMREEGLAFGLFLRQVFNFVVGTALLVGSAHLLVNTAKSVALIYGAPLFTLGIIVALGTTLPEVVFSIRSVLLGHSWMSLGNALGSVVFNITFILGLVAFLSPFAIPDPISLTGSMLLPLLFVVLIQAIYIIKGSFSRVFGLLLVLSAFAFVLYETHL